MPLDLRRIVRAVVASSTSAVGGSGTHLDEIALAELAEGTVSRAQHSAAIAHLAACGHCRRQFASLVELLADETIAAEVAKDVRRRVQDVPRRRLLAGAGILAAAAVVLILVLPRAADDPASEHRGPTFTASAVPTPLSPIGDVASASSLRWSSVAGAEIYRVTLYTTAAVALFETQVADTTVAIPDTVKVVRGQSYLWKVEARTGPDRWTSSELIEFRTFDAQSPAKDSMRLRSRRLSDGELTAEVRARPQEMREALSGTLALSVRGPAAARDEELVAARRLAVAYAAAWRDEFFVREVGRFAAWPLEHRASKVWADSVRFDGVSAYSRDGASAAIAVWRRALARYASIADTAGMAATLGNIGSGHLRDNHVDSADKCLERARGLATAIGDVRVEANAISELGGVSEARDDLVGARARYTRAIALRNRIGDTRGLAADYNNLAGVAQAAGDVDEARRQYEAALAINRREGRTESAATNLVNLAGLASLTGDFARAETFYRDALNTWRGKQEWADAADALRGLGSLELRRGNFPAAGAALVEALTIYDRTGPLEDAISVRQLLANARAAAGELQGALDELRRAQHLADSAHASPAARAGIMLARADLDVRLNARAEAERLYASAEQLFREGHDRAGEAEAQQGRGTLLLDRDDPVRAQDLLDAAFRTETATGNHRAAALTRILLGDLALRRADSAGARRQFTTAAMELQRLGDPVSAAQSLGEHAALEAAARFPAAAESLYRSALRAVGDRIAPEVTWRLHAGLGSIRRARGATDEAARELRAAVADLERTGQSLALPERRSGFLNDKWDVYLQLALLERARGRIAAAFDVSERVRANEMLELLAQGRVEAPRDAGGELVEREQDLRRRIAELSRGVEAAASGGQLVRGPDVSGTGAVTRESLLRAQEAYTGLLLEMRERAPRHAALVSRETVAWRDIARRLAADEALIEYLISDAASLAFVITRDTVVAVNLAVGRRDLARLVDFVRGTLQPRGSTRLDSLWRAPLRQLHRDLIAPVEATGLLAGKTRLIVVPHAELHYLPFAALVGGDGRARFLVERFQVMVTPSASVWLALGARPAHRATGMLAFAPQPGLLPASRREVDAIGRIAGAGARVLVGSGATEAAFRRDAPTSRVIHLATFGVLNKQNPLFSFVELAPGGGDDGRLEAHEVFGLHLTADLVVLSACQTALASGAITDVPAGDDWVGLARAFLSAGATHVIASLWPVQDRATAALMEQFYREYPRTDDPGRALALAQRALIAAPATASPYYWAGFELVGGR